MRPYIRDLMRRYERTAEKPRPVNTYRYRRRENAKVVYREASRKEIKKEMSL